MDLIGIFQNNDPASAEAAEMKLDLSGLEKDAALVKLDDAVKTCKNRKLASIYVSFDPASGQGETLFQPVMRYFKVEKWNGYITHAVPLMTTEKGGVLAVFKI